MRNTRRALLKSVGAIGSLAISGGLSAASAWSQRKKENADTEHLDCGSLRRYRADEIR